jgi:hypothetical protein
VSIKSLAASNGSNTAYGQAVSEGGGHGTQTRNPLRGITFPVCQQSPETPEKTAVCEACAARGAAVDAENAALTAIADPHLAAIVRAWPTLPDALKSGIVAMIQAASK